jgi:hypothetical protein
MRFVSKAIHMVLVVLRENTSNEKVSEFSFSGFLENVYNYW